MHAARHHLVLPLDDAEPAFLEVLLSRFTLERKRNGGGVELRVAFDGSTPAAWNRRGREAVRRRIPRFRERAARYKAQLDRILIDGRRGAFRHDDPRFPFRWASAGALPIVRIGRTDYYCLFFRDVFPIGWNIANGATGTRGELLDPLTTLERELAEELVIGDPRRRRRHVLNWEAAPDRVTVRMGSQTRVLRDCFVNVNAGDFGIELDRVVRIRLSEGAVLRDGEMSGERALNRPVGLFEVSRVRDGLAAGRRSFLPDRFFHDGRPHPGVSFSRFLNEVLLIDIKSWRSGSDIALFLNTTDDARVRLCPVTDTIIRRHMRETRKTAARQSPRKSPPG
jgi:hypothetical protein